MVSNDDMIRMKLDGIKEVIDDSSAHQAETKRRITCNYNQCACRKKFQVGDLVLKKLDVVACQRIFGKLSPN